MIFRTLARTWAIVGTAAPTLLLALGCGSSGEAGDWGGTVRDSAGVTILENAERGLWPADAVWRFEESLRIGVAAGDPAYHLGQVTDLTVDEAGSIYVLDAQARSVRVYDAEGGHVADIGGPGGGPGELGPSLPAVMLGPGDTVMVADIGNQKVQRYLRDGTEAGSFPFPFEGGIPLRFIESPDGAMAYQTRRLELPGSPMEAGDAGGDGDPVVLRSADGTVRDTLVTLTEGESMRVSGGQPRFRLFGAEPAWTFLSDGRLVTGVSSEYRLEVRDADGRIERIVSKPFEPATVTAADRDRMLSFLRSLMEDQGAPPQQLDMMLRSIEFADEHPAFASVMGGPDGTIWVQRPIRTEELDAEALAATELEDLTGSRDWEVFAEDGRFLGTVSFPPRFRPLRWRGDDVYGVRRDDLDVPYVVRLRLVRPDDAT